MQFNLKRDENNKLLTNSVRSARTKLRVLKLRGNKLYYPYNTGGLTIISSKTYYNLLKHQVKECLMHIADQKRMNWGICSLIIEAILRKTPLTDYNVCMNGTCG